MTAALALLSRDGMAGLSLRKVAAALDTGAASLYVYVANLDELHALLLDRVLGEVARLRMHKATGARCSSEC